jgi:hypothetical protein
MEIKSLTINTAHTDKKISSLLISIVQSTLLLFFLFFPLSFMRQFFHEGGHALFNLAQGVPIHFLYAHPFSFVGFVRPMVDYYSIWQHVLGSAVEILVSLLIFILLWKRRSIYTLPFLMILPWTAIFTGIGEALDILGKSGDAYNIISITGLPAIVFYIVDFILAIVGIFFFISLFPLLGLAPEDGKALFVLPAGMLLYAALGSMIANLFVPGSSIDVRYHLAHEIIASAYYRPIFMGLIGVLLAVIYITLYRRVYQKLPVSLQAEKECPTWRNLWYPGLLFTVSVIIGLIVIH